MILLTIGYKYGYSVHVCPLGREREKNDAESNRGKVDSPIAQLVRALH